MATLITNATGTAKNITYHTHAGVASRNFGALTTACAALSVTVPSSGRRAQPPASAFTLL